MTMQTSNNGLAVVQAFEGCLSPDGNGRFKPYVCPAGVLTIGWGHTNHHHPLFTNSDRWSQAKCDEVLRGDLGGFELRVEKLAPEVKLQHRFDALVSWAYNTGGPSDSSVWKYARAGDVEETRVRLSRWNKGGGRVLNGLVRRREAEADLFEGKIDEALRTAGARKPSPQEPSARTDRDKPKPPSAELAKRTKGETAATAAGGVTTGTAASADKTDAGIAGPLITYAAIFIGLALLVAGAVLLVSKVKSINEDWA